MGFIEVFLIGVGLSMDAFAVSICKGLHMKKINHKQSLIIALFFGGFQALMPFLGWALGRNFEQYIKTFDHWIAFSLLVIIGGKMIYDSFKGEDEEVCNNFSIKEIFLLAIATSIDALAVGISFAFLGEGIVKPITIIGITTFVISYVGVIIGSKFGGKFQNSAQTIGGVILILIGVKILLEHLGVIAF